MGRRPRPRRDLSSATPSSARDTKIKDASAMLLYRTPSGITVFSFDGDYLNNPPKDFWACLPPLSLQLCIKYEKVPIPIDLVKEAIHVSLDTGLTNLCGSERKLVVGSAEYERIIGTKKSINCLYVEAPDSEVIIRSLKNPMQSVKINDALAMLLYQAPSGFAIFCFDGGHLNDSVEDFPQDFWESLPKLSLIMFIKKEEINPLNPDTEVFNSRLDKRLMKLCRYGRTLVVGSAEYKRAIGTKLGIKCLHVDVPDCELLICSMNKPNCIIDSKDQSEPSKDLKLFLHQHGFDNVQLKMVGDMSLEDAAYSLHDIELCEKEYLKFFRFLLKGFMATSEIDAKSWVSLHFATALKMICYPGESYKVYPPDKLFSFGEVRKIEAHASGYRRSFSRIDVLSVYDHVVNLDSKKYFLLFKLYLWISKPETTTEPCSPKQVGVGITKAKEVLQNADFRLNKGHSSGKHNRPHIHTGSKDGKEASTKVDGKLNSIAQDNCSEVNLVNHSDLGCSCERQEQDVKKILTITDINSSMEKPNRPRDEEVCNKENDPGMSNQTILAGGQHYLVPDDGILAMKMAASSMLDSRPSKQEKTPGTISGRFLLSGTLLFSLGFSRTSSAWSPPPQRRA